ncbi:MAG: hypothetical protein KKH44_03165, partial [Bacteroidetes bacterium]|nr:hypothetical protein [Bacteroidota bacterium]
MKKSHIIMLFLGLSYFNATAQTADEYYTKAKNLELLQDDKAAIKEYSKAIQKEPKFEKAYIARAAVENRLKKYNDALIDFNNAIAINPKSFKSYFLRAKTKTIVKDYA